MRKIIYIITLLTLIILIYFPQSVRADDTYTVTFKDWEGNIISQETYEKGDSIYIPPDPEKPSTQMYQYFFVGWDPLVSSDCRGDATYEPLYIQDYMRYTVKIGDHLGGTYKSSYGIYGSEAVMLPSISNYLEGDMILSRDQSNVDNCNGKTLWCDFRACVELGLIDYDPTKQYMCTGFESNIDGRICKLSDFAHYTIRGDETYVPVYEPVSSTGTNHMWFVDQFDPDDPERQLSYSEIDLGYSVLEWSIYEMYETQPTLQLPFPEAIAGLDGNTYYLNPYKARLYIGSDTVREYTIPRIFLEHQMVPVDWDGKGSYVLPIYSASPDFDPPDDWGDFSSYAWISMPLYDDDYNQTGTWESGPITPGVTVVTAPDNPGTDIVHWGHKDKVFSGKYNIKLTYMSGPIFKTVNAGESFTCDSLWWRYALGEIIFEPIWDEVITSNVTYLDHDGTVLRNYHGAYYVDIEQPPDPTRSPDRDFEYSFVGWKNLDTDSTMADTSTETGGLLKSKLTYQAVYAATKVNRGDYVVSVPAVFELEQNNGKFEGYDQLIIDIDTNCDCYYVEVVPDPTVTLTGQTTGDTVDVSVSTQFTKFYGMPFRQFETSTDWEFEGDCSKANADRYTGICTFTITSGYD